MIVSDGLGALWGVLDIMQMIYYYVYINATLPIDFQNFLLLFKATLIPLPNIAQIILSQISNKIDVVIPSQKAPYKFDQQDISAFFIINGGGSILLYFLFGLMGTCLFRCFCKFLKRFQSKSSIILFSGTYRMMRWNLSIRYLMVNYLQLSCAVCLQLTNYDTSDSSSIIGQVLNLITLILLLLFLAWAIFMMRKRAKSIQKKNLTKDSDLSLKISTKTIPTPKMLSLP